MNSSIIIAVDAIVFNSSILSGINFNHLRYTLRYTD
jgi:hypothetical protein